MNYPNPFVRDGWRHQTLEVEQHALEPGWFLLWDPRTGKTRPIVLQTSHWIAYGATKILIVAPKTACWVWVKDDELGRYDPAKVRIVPLFDGDVAERQAAAQLLDDSMPTIVVLNRDVLHRMVKPLRKWGPHALVLDECHEYKTPSAACSRAALMLAKRTMFRRGLTGTPDPEDYLDFYGQYKIIAPEVFGTRLDEFEKRYVQTESVFPLTSWPKKVVGYNNVEELREKIFSRASRVRQSECFDMPAVRDITIPVPFTRIARELYTEITKNAVADFYGLRIDGTHQLSRLLVLHQLAAGFVRNEDAVEWVFDGKIDAALEQLETLNGKRVVVFHHYRAEGGRLLLELQKRFEGVRSLHGGTPSRERSATPFLTWPNMRIFIAQEDTANLAISLREADHVVWTSWGPKSDVHYQARQRIFDEREAKPHGLTYSYLQVPQTVDAFFTATVRRKRNASEFLLDVGFQNAAVYEES